MDDDIAEEDAGRAVARPSFLKEALHSITKRGIVLPAILLTIVLTASNIALLYNIPDPGTRPGAGFFVAGFARLAGLWILSVAILRTITASSRSKWRPDWGFWLYGLLMIASLGVGPLLGNMFGDRTEFRGALIGQIASMVLLAPFAAWVVAAAVHRPLAWNPLRWMRSFRRWLPHLLFWTLLLVLPLGLLHGWIDRSVLEGKGDWLLAMLIDGPISALMVLLGLALNATAYRRVAERSGQPPAQRRVAEPAPAPLSQRPSRQPRQQTRRPRTHGRP